MKSNLAVCMSSDRQDWGTPGWLFERYHKIYHFDLDAAATAANSKCRRFIGPPGTSLGEHRIGRESTEIQNGWYLIRECVAVDALTTEIWPGDKCWLNSPYGRDLSRWYAKAYEQAVEYNLQKKVAMLVPARTDTAYWHRYVWDAELQKPYPWILRLDFLKGRVKFDGAEAGAPFPSAVVVFGWGD